MQRSADMRATAKWAMIILFVAGGILLAALAVLLLAKNYRAPDIQIARAEWLAQRGAKLLPTPNPDGCVKPHSGMTIRGDVKLCFGHYDLEADPALHGAIILRGEASLDCQGATLDGHGACVPPGESVPETMAASGIYVEEATNAKITNCVIQNFCIGLTTNYDTANVTIRGNVFIDNGVHRNYGDNIQIMNTRGATIRDNQILGGSNEGVFINDDCHDIAVEGNYVEGVRGNGVAVGQRGAVDLTVRDNVIAGVGHCGVSIAKGADIAIAGNTIIDAAGDGIRIVDADRVTVTGNSIWSKWGAPIALAHPDREITTGENYGENILNLRGLFDRLFF